MSNTRIAPSPTGLMHLGTARTAYINYLQARATGGRFILRIDDTDLQRNKIEYTQVILDTMDWLGLEYDKLYYQSQRLDIYSSVARGLLDRGKAFKASNGALIIKGLPELPESFIDTVAGNIPITETNHEQITDRIVLLRGGDTIGIPTYQFASVVDDYYLDIDHIIRGVDHITNTPKQIAIWNTIDDCFLERYRKLPVITHIGLIFKDKKKLSKRDGAASLLEYKKQGYKPEAILNWLLLMGWSLSVPRGASKAEQKAANEPFSKERAIECFLKGTLKNSACTYDLAKLDWLQRKY